MCVSCKIIAVYNSEGRIRPSPPWFLCVCIWRDGCDAPQRTFARAALSRSLSHMSRVLGGTVITWKR